MSQAVPKVSARTIASNTVKQDAKRQPNKTKSIELYVLPAVLLVLLLLPHILYLGNHYIDVEPYYVKSAQELITRGFDANLSDYFTNIGNPILTSLILSGSYLLFGESYFVSRLTIFVFALVFALFFYFYLRNKEGAFVSFLATLLTVVNPFFIVYSQYITSDVPFMVFSSVSLLLLLFPQTAKGELVSSVMLGVSLTTRYVTAVLFPVVVLYSVIKTRLCPVFSKAKLLSAVRFNLWYFALALVLSVPVISFAFRYQEGVLSRNIEQVITLNFGMYIPRLFAYLLWLGLFIGPFCLVSLLDLWRKIGKKKFLILLICLGGLTLIVSYFFQISTLHVQAWSFGEMNLSWLESVVPAPYLSAALFFVILVAELFVASVVFDLVHLKDKKFNLLATWMLLPIPLMSLTRVANRYLLAVLVPLSLYMAYVTGKMYSGRTRFFIIGIIVLHVLVFWGMGFYSNYYLQLRGLAR